LSIAESVGAPSGPRPVPPPAEAAPIYSLAVSCVRCGGVTRLVNHTPDPGPDESKVRQATIVECVGCGRQYEVLVVMTPHNTRYDARNDGLGRKNQKVQQ